ncbi:MAG: hypothetical protein Q8Q15_00630 [bacterium]|nr:hypothetical protein [bacterium]
MEQGEGETMEKIREELLAMEEEDQRLLKENSTDFSQTAKSNTSRLKEIVGEIGWPSISKVGVEASDAAWLLTQHSDHDLEFQERALAMMKELPEGEIKKRNIAYLEDRVKVRGKGLPQIYGTQFWTDENGKYVPRPIENPDKVDERRAAVGLGSLEKYQDIMEKFNRGEIGASDKIKI